MSKEQPLIRPSYTRPHGGACDFCNQVKPDVYVNSNGDNTCADCDRYDENRWFEFRQEQAQLRKGGK